MSVPQLGKSQTNPWIPGIYIFFPKRAPSFVHKLLQGTYTQNISEVKTQITTSHKCLDACVVTSSCSPHKIFRFLAGLMNFDSQKMSKWSTVGKTAFGTLTALTWELPEPSAWTYSGTSRNLELGAAPEF